VGSIQIPFNGEVTKEILVQAHHYDGSAKAAKRKALIVFLVSYLFVVLAIGPSNQWQIDDSIIFSLLMTTGLFVFVWWYVIERGERNNLNRNINRHGQGEITESSIIFRSNKDSSTINWGEFTRYRKENEMVLLYGSPKSGLFTVFHRSFFTCEEDWNRFVSLVKKNTIA